MIDHDLNVHRCAHRTFINLLKPFIMSYTRMVKCIHRIIKSTLLLAGY